ncbi:MAG: A/G-specific adenine glycosylase [Deltaproteobacteria bacterium]|nr:A/G-specific adenine glycosylase [Deltaproteobacteria bacterium]MBN2845104.1 A/G-specific adenine glycosylase [Deltaproteobacteria bacterium]
MKSQKTLSQDEITEFRKTVYHHWEYYGRDLPWRKTDNPYNIIVSEIMLQQTQVARVITKYEEFITTFPDIESLARAPLQQVLTVWHGLGYNRRALSLRKMAEEIVTLHDGRIPNNVTLLKTLPGIGNATAHAVCAFAFNQPVIFIETNIRTVFIHHFFSTKGAVNDSDMLPLITQTLDSRNPRRWYNALMDYGASLKKGYPNPGRKSAHYKRQSPFKGSRRQVRGAVLSTLVESISIAKDELAAALPFDKELIHSVLSQLEREELIVVKNGVLFIA